ncbi:MAG: sensor histidine kinase [Proteobacteria bacterium]|nr:sensor histidine kinase [Pseudomonadota bacterium]
MQSLKKRLAIWVFLPTLLISVTDLLITYLHTDEVATLVQQQLLKGSAKIISEQLAFVDGGYELSVPPAALELFATKYQDRVFYSVRSPKGMLIAGTEDLAPYEEKLQIEQEKYYSTTLRDERVRVIAYAHTLPNTSNDYAVTQVAQTMNSHDGFKRDLFWLTMREHLVLLTMVVIGLVIAFRWTLSPVKSFGERLARRKPGSLEKLDENSAPEELAPVIHSMNDYVAELDKTLTSYEQFVANTAHHLRTSFAILTSQVNYGMRSGDLNQTQTELLNAIQKTILQGTKVINQLLVLAAVEQNKQQAHSRLASTKVNLAEVITSVMEELAPLAQQKQVELGVNVVEDDIVIAAPIYLIREVVASLIDNSIQHMQQAGVVSLSLQRQGAHCLLSVVDNGQGIPPAERQKVFARFYRLDESKPNSSGLGLAIVKEICDTLLADVSLRTPKNGIGLQVDILFPLGGA